MSATGRPEAGADRACPPPPAGADVLAAAFADRRGRALLRAAEVFAERGYRETRVGNLCAGLGIDELEFLELFDDEAECLRQLFDRLVIAVRECLLAAVSPLAPWPRRIAAALAVIFGLLARHPALARVALVEIEAGDADGWMRLDAALRHLAPFLAEGRDVGLPEPLRPPPVELMLLHGVAYAARLRIGDPEGLEQAYPEMLRYLLCPYLDDAELEQAVRDNANLPGARRRRDSWHSGRASS